MAVPRFVNRVVLAVLASRWHRLAGDSLVGLAVTGARTGRVHTFPVSAVPAGPLLVVLPGHPERKTWWRNLTGRPSVRVLRDGRWSTATAELVRHGDDGWGQARDAYVARHPGLEIASDAPLVVLHQDGPSEAV